MSPRLATGYLGHSQAVQQVITFVSHFRKTEGALKMIGLRLHGCLAESVTISITAHTVTNFSSRPKGRGTLLFVALATAEKLLVIRSD